MNLMEGMPSRSGRTGTIAVKAAAFPGDDEFA
jgi:hypothetical protein